MRWRPVRRSSSRLRPSADPVVLSVTSPLNLQTARDLAMTVARLEPTAPVVIDLTEIPAFDTDGAEELLHLQEAQHDRDLSIVGFRKAAARLVGADDADDVLAPPGPETGTWVQRRLHHLVVVQPHGDPPFGADGLETALAEAGRTDSAIVVVDLRDVVAVDGATIDTIAFASSMAAVRGQELLVVNVSAEVAEMLRAAGLSATTYVAPGPPGV